MYAPATAMMAPQRIGASPRITHLGSITGTSPRELQSIIGRQGTVKGYLTHVAVTNARSVRATTPGGVFYTSSLTPRGGALTPRGVPSRGAGGGGGAGSGRGGAVAVRPMCGGCGVVWW